MKEIEASTGFPHCVWKGRQGAWWVAEGIRALMQEVSSAMTETLEHLFEAADVATRNMARQTLEKVRNKLKEILHDKLSFWSHVPWRLVGVFYCCLGGDVQLSKDILRECIAEYDRAVQTTGYDSLHRVAHRILDPLRASGRELREWLMDNYNAPLERFFHAYTTLREYALISLVERRIESVHAIIKRLMRKVTFIMPARVCAEVRLDYNMELLQKNADFHSFALNMYRKRDLLDKLLHNLYASDVLRTMTQASKLKAVYQCGLDDEYTSTAAAREEQHMFEQIVAISRPQPVPQQNTTIFMVAFLKEVFRRGDFYALPRRLFDPWLGTRGAVEPRAADVSLDNLLGLVGGVLPDGHHREETVFHDFEYEPGSSVPHGRAARDLKQEHHRDQHGIERGDEDCR